MNPYLIEGPAIISFSGGRTSGYMLHQILDAGLQDDVHVVFANTGKEMEETLKFVQECSDRWGVHVTWLEYQAAEEPKDRWRLVDFETASRNGEPFEQVNRKKRFLPNPVTRFCTSELKVKAMARWIAATMAWPAWTSVVGIRADEPRRVARISVPNRDRDERYAPLAVAGVGVEDVLAFWKSQSFDLALPVIDNKTYHGNCDLCFLKGYNQVQNLIREEPARAIWWAQEEQAVGELAEKKTGAFFRCDRPSYTEMYEHSLDQPELFPWDDQLIDCFCGD